MKTSAWLAVCFVLLGLLAWSQMSPQLQTVPTSPAPAQTPVAGEDHPHMDAAIRSLEEAKRQLEAAAHDYGGHRLKALEDTQLALDECRKGLAYDKK